MDARLLRLRRSLQVEAMLQPRYPMFGGWKVQFTFGWSLPLRNFVTRLGGGRMQLTQKLSTPLQGVIVDDLTVKVLAPSQSPVSLKQAGGMTQSLCDLAAARDPAHVVFATACPHLMVTT